MSRVGRTYNVRLNAPLARPKSVREEGCMYGEKEADARFVRYFDSILLAFRTNGKGFNSSDRA
jgi:hypothetical protein